MSDWIAEQLWGPDEGEQNLGFPIVCEWKDDNVWYSAAGRIEKIVYHPGVVKTDPEGNEYTPMTVVVELAHKPKEKK
jgi:hypothetical protein